MQVKKARDQDPENSSFSRNEIDNNGASALTKVLCIILAVLVLLYAAWFAAKYQYLKWLVQSIKNFNHNDPWIAICLIIAINFAFSWLPIPGQSYVNIAISVLQKNSLKSFLIFYSSNLGAATICYFSIKFFIKDCMLRKYEKNRVFLIFREEAKENPWTVSWLFNCVFIPSCFKNLSLPLTEMTFL